MFTHEEIWTALDRLATANNYSTSGLAKKAGLDPTTFNKSKRITADGKPRWPSTESIAKTLAAADATLVDLIGFIENTPTQTTSRSGPLDHFELSQDHLKQLNQKPLPALISAPKGSYAVTLATAQWAPIYKKDSTLIVTQANSFTAGETVLIETKDKQFIIMTVDGEDAKTISLRAIVINEPDRRVEKSDIVRSAKILWASQ
ncbi:MAG: hypothetical protein ACPG05_03125 [Bdellovibrionales bacterium]